jgi:hypothetical protein
VPLFDQWVHPLSAVQISAQLAEWERTPRGEVLMAQTETMWSG